AEYARAFTFHPLQQARVDRLVPQIELEDGPAAHVAEVAFHQVDLAAPVVLRGARAVQVRPRPRHQFPPFALAACLLTGNPGQWRSLVPPSGTPVAIELRFAQGRDPAVPMMGVSSHSAVDALAMPHRGSNAGLGKRVTATRPARRFRGQQAPRAS